MEIWLDTVDRKTIEHARELGFLQGVTTNPSIVARSKEPLERLLEDLLKRQPGPVAVQVIAHQSFEMVEEAKNLHDFSSRIIVKIPATEEGFKAIASLSHLRIPTMATAVFDPIQGLLAAKSGAAYIAPYLSHIGEHGFKVIQSLYNMLTRYNLPSKILVAALESPLQVLQCGELGFHAVTIKETIFQELVEAPAQTVHHLSKFQEDWKEAASSRLFPQHV